MARGASEEPNRRWIGVRPFNVRSVQQHQRQEAESDRERSLKALTTAQADRSALRSWRSTTTRVARGVFIARRDVASPHRLVRGPFSDISTHVVERPTGPTLPVPTRRLEGPLIAVGCLCVTDTALKRFSVGKRCSTLPLTPPTPLTIATETLTRPAAERLGCCKIDPRLRDTSLTRVFVDIHAIGLARFCHGDRLISLDASPADRAPWKGRRRDDPHPTRAAQRAIITDLS